jgi:transcriptional regulator with XRE-family HTH domain
MSVVINGIQYVPRIKMTATAELGTLGQALRTMRKAAKMSLDKAAAEIGRSKSYLWELEHDKSEPGLRVAAELACMYGVPLATLAACLQSANAMDAT